MRASRSPTPTLFGLLLLSMFAKMERKCVIWGTVRGEGDIRREFMMDCSVELVVEREASDVERVVGGRLRGEKSESRGLGGGMAPTYELLWVSLYIFHFPRSEKVFGSTSTYRRARYTKAYPSPF